MPSQFDNICLKLSFYTSTTISIWHPVNGTEVYFVFVFICFTSRLVKVCVITGETDNTKNLESGEARGIYKED